MDDQERGDTPKARPESGKTYRLVTIEDVFNLPTAEMVGRCLHELAVSLQTTRATEDLLNATAASLSGESGGKKWISIPWPGFVDWTDDNGGETSLKFDLGDGKGSRFEIGLQHSPRNEKP